MMMELKFMTVSCLVHALVKTDKQRTEGKEEEEEDALCT